MLSLGIKKEKGMKKKGKSMKMATMPLTWCDFIRWRSVKSKGGKDGRRERRWIATFP
jgi:hypothetical protein